MVGPAMMAWLCAGGEYGARGGLQWVFTSCGMAAGRVNRDIHRGRQLWSRKYTAASVRERGANLRGQALEVSTFLISVGILGEWDAIERLGGMKRREGRREAEV